MSRKLFIFSRARWLTFFLLVLGISTGCGGTRLVVGTNGGNAANTNDSRQTNAPANANMDELPRDLSKIPTVTYCDLVSQPARYDRKIVRVRAVYYTTFEKMYLFDNRCETGAPPEAPEKVPAETWAEWDKLFVSKGDSDEAKLNRGLNGFGRKDATLIGRFNSTSGEADAPNRFGHMNCCRFQFQILRVEKITDIQSN
jgi:hypothetical protein